jgi:hypothetical protein
MQLRNEYQQFNLPDEGNKSQLINRLKKYKNDQLTDLSEKSTSAIVAAKLANAADERTTLAEAKSTAYPTSTEFCE